MCCCLFAELEDDMSSDDFQQGGSEAIPEDEEPAEESSSSEEEEEDEEPKQQQQPAKRPLSSRVRVVQGRRKPPLAPKPKEAAAPAKRSFLTLAVSARKYCLRLPTACFPTPSCLSVLFVLIIQQLCLSHRANLLHVSFDLFTASDPAVVCAGVLCVCFVASRPVKKRSEVDRRLEQLVLKQSWKLKEPSKQSVIKVGMLIQAVVQQQGMRLAALVAVAYADS